MPTPTKDATEVLVGFANGFIAPVGTTNPAETVDLGGSWPSGWYHYGYTEEGLTLNWERDITDHYVEEQSLKIFSTINQSSMSIEFQMAETTMQNLKYALGGGTLTTTAAGASQIGKETLVISSVPTEYAFGFEVENADGFWKRIIIPRGLFLGSLEVEFRRAEQKHVYGCEYHAACEEDDIYIVNKTALATS